MRAVRNRDSMKILYDIVFAGKVGSRKTHIMRSSNLSYKKFMPYFDFVLHEGLLEEKLDEEDLGVKLYTLTDRGLEFLRSYESLLELAPSVSNSTNQPNHIEIRDHHVQMLSIGVVWPNST